MSADQDSSIPSEPEIESMRELSSAQILQVWEQLGLGNGDTGIQLNTIAQVPPGQEEPASRSDGALIYSQKYLPQNKPWKSMIFFFVFPPKEFAT